MLIRQWTDDFFFRFSHNNKTRTRKHTIVPCYYFLFLSSLLFFSKSLTHLQSVRLSSFHTFVHDIGRKEKNIAKIVNQWEGGNI